MIVHIQFYKRLTLYVKPLTLDMKAKQLQFAVTLKKEEKKHSSCHKYMKSFVLEI